MTLDQLEGRVKASPTSPLFARVAEGYLSAGRLDEAQQLCEAGLRRYPRYASAALVLARCFSARNDYSSALDQLERVLNSQPENKLVKQLQREWLELLESFPPLPHPPQEIPIEMPELAAEMETEVIVPEALPREAEPSPEAVVDPQVSERETGLEFIEIRKEQIPTAVGPPTHQVPEEAKSASSEAAGELEKLVVSLQTADRITAPVEPPPPPKQEELPAPEEEPSIASATLAEIYADQGAFDAAIATYRKLQKIQPHKVEQYELRIRQLRGRMKS